jgi:hypothetical protein
MVAPLRPIRQAYGDGGGQATAYQARRISNWDTTAPALASARLDELENGKLAGIIEAVAAVSRRGVQRR